MDRPQLVAAGHLDGHRRLVGLDGYRPGLQLGEDVVLGFQDDLVIEVADQRQRQFQSGGAAVGGQRQGVGLGMGILVLDGAVRLPFQRSGGGRDGEAEVENHLAVLERGQVHQTVGRFGLHRTGRIGRGRNRHGRAVLGQFHREDAGDVEGIADGVARLDAIIKAPFHLFDGGRERIGTADHHRMRRALAGRVGHDQGAGTRQGSTLPERVQPGRQGQRPADGGRHVAGRHLQGVGSPGVRGGPRRQEPLAQGRELVRPAEGWGKCQQQHTCRDQGQLAAGLGRERPENVEPNGARLGFLGQQSNQQRRAVTRIR